MDVQMRWVGGQDREIVGETRARCYGGADKELPRFQESLTDERAVDGDFLLAECDGRAVGTATCLSMSMWVRGGRVQCQGVAWVGTIKTHRRRTNQPGGGIASQIMGESLRRAREREQVVSALMPFRGSFYERFGYGIVERRSTWTVPLAILPSGECDGADFLEPADRAALGACRQRAVESGQCDIERSHGGWNVYLDEWKDGLVVVDRAADGSIHGYLAFQHQKKNEKDIVNVTEAVFDDIDGLRRLLHFLATLRDQYTFAALTLPADLPVNRLLREAQLPHRLVNHPHAEVRSLTRMQVRVLDHKRLIEAMHLPAAREGKIVVAVKESEGGESRFAIDCSAGRASVSATAASPDFACAAPIWAPIVCGELSASTAVKLGLVSAVDSRATDMLEVFRRGPVPFCQEYF